MPPSPGVIFFSISIMRAFGKSITFLLPPAARNASLRSLILLSITTLYSSNSYIAVEDYPAALASFFQCLSAPASALSQIVICAVKKARLVALIHYGRELRVSA